MIDPGSAARAQMVQRLLERRFSRRIVAAMGRLRREQFVPHFWTTSPSFRGQGDDPMVEYEVGDPPDPAALELLYDIERAHGVNRVNSAGGRATSTASAPTVLAGQADALWLESATSVLEIGTGIGYFAALLAELVGPLGRVTSIEIDPDVAARAGENLAREGYSNVTVVTRDGHAGASELGPFDRIVLSVGCNDISRAWLEQLAPGSFALVPLLHGAGHPMLRVEGSGRGRVIMRSGYIRIQGEQADYRMWPHVRERIETSDTTPLAAELARALPIEQGRDFIGYQREWDLSFWIAINDQRAGRSLISLADGEGSTAQLQMERGSISWGGPSGTALRDDLLAHAEGWLAAQMPRWKTIRIGFCRSRGRLRRRSQASAGCSADSIIIR